MFKILSGIFNECRRYVLNGLSKKRAEKNKKGDITKYFDKYIENLIILRLKEKCKLKAEILSEELHEKILINKKFLGKNNYIIIDPVDGSDNYVAGIPFVCMGISIFDNKKIPIYSFVGNYYSGDWIYADKKKVVFSSKNFTQKQKDKKILIYTFSKLKLSNIKHLEKLINSFDIIRSLGATIGEMILVVKGSAAAFVDIRGKLTLENFAPFFLISKHLGLKLTDAKGQDIVLNNFSMTQRHNIIFAKCKVLKKIIKD